MPYIVTNSLIVVTHLGSSQNNCNTGITFLTFLWSHLYAYFWPGIFFYLYTVVHFTGTFCTETKIKKSLLKVF